MVAFDLALAGEAAGTLGPSALALGSLAATGILGVTDLFGGDGDEEDPSEGSATEGSGMFDESEFDDGGGDEFAFDDGGEFDDFDVDGMEGDDASSAVGVAELEGRVDEIEQELSSLSSTVSTVRTENEQIGESVEEVEENVRKLLDIYKMVTKGVNPFVDQKGNEAMGGAPGGSLGLFQDDEEEAEETHNLDSDVVEAEAEEFFDDDFDEDEEPDFEEGADDEGTADDADDETESEGGSKSFEELREEYEEGGGWDDEDDADADEEAVDEDESAEEDAGEPAAEPDDEEATDDEPEGEAVEEDETPGDGEERFEDLVEDQPEEEPTERRVETTRTAPEEQATRDPASAAEEQAAAASDAEERAPQKPYLTEVPPSFVAEHLLTQWVQFLVAEGGYHGARHAISYYETVEWIDAPVANRLRAYLDGHRRSPVEDAEASLTMDHHATSLQFVARIDGDVVPGSIGLGERERRRRRPQRRERPSRRAEQ